MKYIKIEKDLIPYRFDIQLAEKTYTFEVHYNSEYDFFTVDLYIGDEAIIYGEKLVYGKRLFDYPSIDFPVEIVPRDNAEEQSRVGYDNLEDSVFLYIIEGDSNG